MSENGPREGTRDLPKASMATGGRAVDPDSLAGAAYASVSRSLRRRRAEIVTLVAAGGSFSSVAKAYETEHPLEPEVTQVEIEAALAEVKIQARPAAGRTKQASAR